MNLRAFSSEGSPRQRRGSALSGESWQLRRAGPKLPALPEDGTQTGFRRPAENQTGPSELRRSVAFRKGAIVRGRAAPRQLRDLISIGPAMLRDFALLEIRSVAQLARQNPRQMYARLSRKTGQRQDPCVLDTFCAAVAQARNPRLPAEQCQWWYWSRKRKQEERI